MSLTSVDAAIWNQIVEQYPVRSRWAKRMFKLDNEALSTAENREYLRLKGRHGQKVASALLDVRHLLLESVAISQFRQDRPDLAEMIPELTSVTEAVTLASMEHRLNQSQQRRLGDLLTAEFQEPKQQRPKQKPTSADTAETA